MTGGQAVLITFLGCYVIGWAAVMLAHKWLRDRSQADNWPPR